MKKAKSSTIFLIISSVLTIAICAVMNLYLIPLIESSAQGMRMFDMNAFGYSFEQAKTFVSQLSQESLHTYLHIQLPLDFVYPLAYTLFFSLALQKLMPQRKYLIILPVLLMISDYCENIFSIIMLTTDFTQLTAKTASSFTIAKSVLMYVVIILVLVLFVKWVIGNKKAKKNN